MLLNNIPLGIYYPGASLLHRMQARTKIVLMLIIAIYLVIAGRLYWNFVPYLAASALVIAAIVASGISWREIGRRLWLLLIIVLLSTVLGMLVPVGLPDTSRVFYVLPPLSISGGLLGTVIGLVGGLVGLSILLARLPLATLRRPSFQRRLKRTRAFLIFSGFIVCSALLYGYFSQPSLSPPRLAYLLTYDSIWYPSGFFVIFLVLSSCSLLLTMTTSPVALIEGLTLLMKPLRWLRLPVDDFALMTLLALRFIPTLIEEVGQLVKAQSARGASFNRGSLRERLQSLIALFVPLLRNTLRRASELATALDARGYQVDGQQTNLHEKALARIDYLALFLVCSFCLLALIW